jgi:uncharacterized protein (TIGR02452 family)
MTPRDRRAAIAKETLDASVRGEYLAPSGGRVLLGTTVSAAVAATREVRPEESLALLPAAELETAIEVVNEDALAAARRLGAPATSVAVLVHASARNPGGGFLTGAQAQEEALARASALYSCLDGRAMYAHHRAHRDVRYTSWVIHCPQVPVIREPGERLLDEPWLCSFLVSPAVNASAARQHGLTDLAIREAMEDRVDRLLAVAGALGYRRLVLGAWGCGVFGNHSAEVAAMFREALAGPHRGRFERVCFAILERGTVQPLGQAFRRAFELHEG